MNNGIAGNVNISTIHTCQSVLLCKVYTSTTCQYILQANITKQSPSGNVT